MAKTHQRVFALVGAILFLGTSLAVSGVVIWQAKQQDNNELTNQSKIEETLKQQTQQQKQSTNRSEGQLEGTKLSNFTPLSSVDKLQYVDTVVGTGEMVKAGATVTAHYTGALVKDGTIFQSSHDGQNQPVEFPLSGVIAGWTQGVPGMKVGGTRRLIIPAQLAYGAQSPAANIPANSDLVFDIELTAVKNQ